MAHFCTKFGFYVDGLNIEVEGGLLAPLRPPLTLTI